MNHTTHVGGSKLLMFMDNMHKFRTVTIPEYLASKGYLTEAYDPVRDFYGVKMHLGPLDLVVSGRFFGEGVKEWKAHKRKPKAIKNTKEAMVNPFPLFVTSRDESLAYSSVRDAGRKCCFSDPLTGRKLERARMKELAPALRNLREKLDQKYVKYHSATKVERTQNDMATLETFLSTSVPHRLIVTDKSGIARPLRVLGEASRFRYVESAWQSRGLLN